jgi:hypothetical protein
MIADFGVSALQQSDVNEMTGTPLYMRFKFTEISQILQPGSSFEEELRHKGI